MTATDYDPYATEPKPDGVKLTTTANAAEQRKQDIVDLMEQKQFHRWLLTFVELARMDEPDHQVDVTVLAMKAGRRNLGLEVLTAIRAVEPRVDVFLAVEKSQTLENRR